LTTNSVKCLGIWRFFRKAVTPLVIHGHMAADDDIMWYALSEFQRHHTMSLSHQTPAIAAVPEADDTLEKLIRSCASILTKCLSYHPATGQLDLVPPRSTAQTENELDEQIFQAQLELRARRNSRRSLLDKAVVAKLQLEHTEQKFCLQQENLLLKRLTLSRATSAAVEQNLDPDRVSLRREAARMRDREMTLAIQRQRELSILLSSIRTLELECHRQRAQNRDVFEQLMKQKEEEKDQPLGDRYCSAAMESDDESDPEGPMLAKQIIVLKHLLKDLVVGSGVDWYNDFRLRRILLAPQHDDNFSLH
jgi:hypothetical protein